VRRHGNYRTNVVNVSFEIKPKYHENKLTIRAMQRYLGNSPYDRGKNSHYCENERLLIAGLGERKES
jgi:hypothetical protein